MSDADVAPNKQAQVAVTLEWLRSRPWRASMLAGLGATITIGLLAYANATGVLALLIAPFGASCALVFGAPASPLAQPRNVIGGHLVAGFCGVAAAQVIGDPSLAMAVGVGLAIFGMLVTNTLHPPAGANPIVIVLGHAGWTFLAAPLLAGSCTIVIIGILFHRVVTGARYH